MRYRYPGIKPFSEQDKDIFFGRATDISQLFDLILLEQTVLLYAKSGIGKSSLLHAGIYPLLAEKTNYKPLNVRFTAFVSENQSTPPLQTFGSRLPESPLHFVLKQLGVKNSLWTHFKSLQMTNPDQQYLLVFDQFEELFSYPEAQVQDFAKALSELLYTQVPQEIREKLEEMTNLFPDFLSEQEKEILLTPLAVKVVFSIRADRMSQLNQVKNHLPNLLRISYELKTLSDAQAIEAISTPAQKEKGEVFFSHKFSYEDKAMTQIMDYLTQKGKKSVETFQLQMICQHIERNIVIKYDDTFVEPHDIGDISDITENYYNEFLDSQPKAQRQNVQKLIEEGLIYEEEERRLTLDEAIVKRSYQISVELLKSLVDSHWLRAEINASEHYSYELSHDTLVPAIVKARKKRKEKQRKQRNRALVLYSIVGIVLSIVMAAAVYVWEEQKQEKQLETLNKELTEIIGSPAIDSATGEKKDLSGQIQVLKEKQKKLNQLLNPQADTAQKTTNNQQSTTNLSLEEAISKIEQKVEKADTTLKLTQELTKKLESRQNNAQEVQKLIKKYTETITTINKPTTNNQQITINNQKVEKEDYEYAKKQNSLFAYDRFLTAYPKSKYKQEIERLKTQRQKAIADSTANANKQLPIDNKQPATNNNQEKNKEPETQNTKLETANIPTDLQLITVEGGEYQMGCDEKRDGNCDDDEKPLHSVTVKTFQMSKYEITNAQYAQFLNEYGSDKVKSGQNKGQEMIYEHQWGVTKVGGTWQAQKGYESHPVVYVTWYGASEFCRHYGGRLPTEEEWEYAARGGKKSKNYKYAGGNNIESVAWYDKNSGSKTHPVGQKSPNELGLYDLSGNVWEWTASGWSDDYEKPRSANRYVLRGGSWVSIITDSRVAYRDDGSPDSWNDDDGFRFVR